MNGERIARSSLALDAASCAVAGVTMAFLRRPIARFLHAPRPLIGAAGAGTATWAAVVALQSVRGDWRTGAAQVGAANMAATVALLSAAVLHPERRARIVLSLTAAEVAAFGVTQLVALIDRRD